MKKLLLLLLVVPFLISAQWSFSEKNDPFDGNVKTVIAQGYGGDFPYQNPSLVFRIQGNKREIYISGAGSTSCDMPYLDISFGDPNSIESFDLDESIDKKAGFINMNETKKIFELVKNLMEMNTAYFRFGTDCSSNRFKFSLRGSSKSLSKIFADIDFSSFDSNTNFENFYSAADNLKKKSKSKLYLEKFISDKNIKFSPYDMRVIYKEIEKVFLIRKLELTEIIIENPKFLNKTIKLKLGFEGTYYTETPYVFIKEK